MAVFKSSLVKYCVLSLLFRSVLTIPVNERSNPGDEHSNPIDRDVKIEGWEDIAEENCYAMLCLHGGERVWQRAVADDASSRHRQDTGTNLRPPPFHADQLGRRHTEQITENTISAEEFPWASLEKGGEGATLMPATEAQQNSQKNAISAALSGVNRSKWMRITMVPSNLFGKYCTALHANPQDTSVCDEDTETTIFGKAGVKLAQFAFVLDKSTRPFQFRKVHPNRKGSRSVGAGEFMFTEPLPNERVE